MTARIGVVTFPGSLDDRDTQRAIRVAGAEPVALWHKDKDLKQVDAVVLCGGFSYGDYLRAGAIARFSPVMDTVIDQAKAGLPVLGICNGFQILTEAHLLPGGMLGNDHLHNPNGSLNDIAGITNAAGNVVGLMPHPEHAVESLIGTGRTDGLPFFTSILKKLVNA